MIREDETRAKASFFSRHLHITGVEVSEHISATDVASDIEAMDLLKLPNLDLSAVATNSAQNVAFFNRAVNSCQDFYDKFFVSNAEFLGVAAMLLLFIIPFSTFRNDAVLKEEIRAKGSDRITIYRERNAQVVQITTFDQPLALLNGDRIRVEVLTSTEKTAYYFISSGLHGRVLTGVDEMLGERMAMAPGERAIFPGSIELIGENEGETLNVVLCSAPLESSQASEIIDEYLLIPVRIPKGCLLKTIRLR